MRVLTEKFSWEQHRAISALQTILARGIRVKIRGTVKVCRDPNDDMFLECAALAKVDLLVAGDNLIGVYPSGSFMKGTAVLSGTDIDLFISLSELSDIPKE